MNRATRTCMAVLALVMFAPPLAAEAQQAAKLYRIGVLSVQSPEVDTDISALRDGLRELGLANYPG